MLAADAEACVRFPDQACLGGPAMKERLSSALLWCVFLLLTVPAMPSRAHADDWLPISQEDLAMKDNPKHPGDHAMILWREVVVDDLAARESEYVRIKIFDDVGKHYADVEIQPIDLPGAEIGNVQGRTIHPGGAIIPFDGKVFDKQVKYRYERLTAKTFTLPQVTPGSIIEYRYTRSWGNWFGWGAYARTYWGVQEDLFQRKAHFSLNPAGGLILRWSSAGLSADHAPVVQKNGKITLDMEDMPGYEIEPNMPPESEVGAHVTFFYLGSDTPKSVDGFWKEEGKNWARWTDEYMDKSGAVKRELASLIGPSDTNSVKLQKIYDRVQSLRNLSFERDKTEKEIKREKRKELSNIEDVLRNGYGWHDEINSAFVALARGAGFDATLVEITDRSDAFFDKNLLSMRQFEWKIVRVREDGKDLYLDPGIPFCPFGLIAWENTSTLGLLLDKNPVFVRIPAPAADKAGITRRADLTLQQDGSIHGTVEITFSGMPALNYRLEERNEDEAARKKDMEDLLRGWVPASATVELQKVNDWKSSKLPLVATYQVTIPAYTSAAGSRVILPMTVFVGAYRNPFVSKQRSNPILFSFPYADEDDVTVHLAPEYQLDSLPKGRSLKNGVSEFSADCKIDSPTVLHATRQLRLNQISIDAKYYAALRAYFGQIEATDDEQALLKLSAN
jgi:hypothetical protein